MERFGLTVSGQLLELIRFAAVGVVLGVWYDVFRLVRLMTRPAGWQIFFEDLLFFASAAAVTLLASLPICYGDIRLFHLLAMAVGFAVYYHTVGRIVYQTERLIVGILEKIWAKIAGAAGKVAGGFSVFIKKVFENCKKRLHVDGEV